MLETLLLAAILSLVGEIPPKDGDLALRLTWEVDPGCPDVDYEQAEIRRRVDELGPTTSSEPIRAQGTIRRAPSGEYRLRLRTQVGESEGERAIVGKDCRELADAAALVLALLFHPEMAAPATPPPAPPPASPAQPPRPPAKGPPRFGVGLDAVLATRALPGMGEGLGVRFFHRRGAWTAELGLTGFLPIESRAPLLPGAMASFLRLESALRLCASTASDRRLGAALCVGGAVVRLRGRSAGVSDAGQATAYWPEALLAGVARLTVTAALHLRLAAEIHGLGDRPDFAILGLGSVYRPAAYNARGTLGIDVIF